MRNAELDEAKGRMKISGRNISNLRYADYINQMAESEEELKSLLIKEKGVKKLVKTQHSKNEDHGAQPHHFMANRRGNCGSSDKFSVLGL